MKQLLEKLALGEDLLDVEAERGMECIASGNADATQVAVFLALLRAKGETPIEIKALVEVMLRHCISVQIPVCFVCIWSKYIIIVYVYQCMILEWKKSIGHCRNWR